VVTNTSNEETPRQGGSTAREGRGKARTGANGTSLLTDHDVLCTLVRSLEASTRRWQLVVFPSLFAFVLLAIYGFYLIFNLVEDVDRMADTVYLNMGFMSDRMSQISQNIDALSGTVRDISINLDDLTGNVTAMNATVLTISVQMATMPAMLEAIQDMDFHIQEMQVSMVSMDEGIGAMAGSIQVMNGQMAQITAATQHISGNVSGLNQSIGRPMNFMNSMMPW
jgi:methyl-accepting chemotaxis protein